MVSFFLFLVLSLGGKGRRRAVKEEVGEEQQPNCEDVWQKEENRGCYVAFLLSDFKSVCR